jgi:membrane peptidoglycan carboxypeptidase
MSAPSPSGLTRTRTQLVRLQKRTSKDELLAFYLNALDFGRGVAGIERAANVYFDKSARVDAYQAQRLTTAEAMALLAIIDHNTLKAVDPSATAEAEQANRRRWQEIRDRLVTAGKLSPEQAQSLTYPGPQPLRVGGGMPATGPVVDHVLDELTHTSDSPVRGQSWQSVRDAGLTITITIDPVAQWILESTLDPSQTGSVLDGQSELRGAGVVVEPGTGRVLAYYGGPPSTSGTQRAGTTTPPGADDRAGVVVDETGKLIGAGAHPAGSSFMAYTLAAALRQGWSLNSLWRWQPDTQRPAGRLPNSGQCPGNATGQTCSLLQSVRSSLTAPIYDVTSSLGAQTVASTAREAGITTIWDRQANAWDLRTTEATKVADDLGNDLGIGQYAVTVLDQANAMATFANQGRYAVAHFVQSVASAGNNVWPQVVLNPAVPGLLEPGQWADLTYALSNGGLFAIKTGTVFGVVPAPTDAWSIGYTQALAAAIWVGSETGTVALFDRTKATYIDGEGMPSTALRSVLSQTQDALRLPQVSFPAPAFGGDLHPPGSV